MNGFVLVENHAIWKAQGVLERGLVVFSRVFNHEISCEFVLKNHLVLWFCPIKIPTPPLVQTPRV